MTKEKLTRILTMVSLVGASAAIGFFAVTLGINSAKALSAPEAIILFILIVPAFFLVIGIHEAGHAIAGILVKFDFRMYVVGPFMWDKEENGWKFKWNKNVNLSGGLVICLPLTTEHLARRFSIYASGGPIASLILAAGAFGLKQLFPVITTESSSIINVIGLLLGLFGTLSLLIFIVTAAPLHTGGFYSDGARVIRFLRGGDTSRFEIMTMKIFTSSSAGLRPRFLNIDDLNEAMALAKKLKAPMGVYLNAYFYQMAFDKGDLDQAEKYLKEYIAEIENIPKGIRGAVWLDAAYFYSFARKDLEQAEYFWNKFEPSAILPKAQVFAAEAALLSLKKDFEKMNGKIDAAVREIPNMLDRGVGIALHDQLLQLRSDNSHVPN
ncbi:hypothetical protein BH09BAC3_BH09BAC3_22600 [soil metagenome]